MRAIKASKNIYCYFLINFIKCFTIVSNEWTEAKQIPSPVHISIPVYSHPRWFPCIIFSKHLCFESPNGVFTPAVALYRLRKHLIVLHTFAGPSITCQTESSFASTGPCFVAGSEQTDVWAAPRHAIWVYFTCMAPDCKKSWQTSHANCFLK